MVWVHAVAIDDAYCWIDSVWLDRKKAAGRADAVRAELNALAGLHVFLVKLRLEDVESEATTQLLRAVTTLLRAV